MEEPQHPGTEKYDAEGGDRLVGLVCHLQQGSHRVV